MLTPKIEPQYPAHRRDMSITVKLDPAPHTKRLCENGTRDVKPKFWKADSACVSATSAASTSPASPPPLRAPTPDLDKSSEVYSPGSQGCSRVCIRESRQNCRQVCKPMGRQECEQDGEEEKPSSPIPDIEMEKLSLERKAHTEEPPSPPATLRAPSPDLRPTRPISQSASPPLRSPAQVLKPQPQHHHQNYGHQRSGSGNGNVSNLQSRRPKPVPHLVTSLPSPRRIVSHHPAHAAHGDKVYATASPAAHSAHPASAAPLSPYFLRSNGPYDYARAHGLAQPPGPMSARVSSSTAVRTNYRYAPYSTPTAPPTPVRTGFILTSPTNTTNVKGKHLVLVSTDVAENLRRGKAIAIQSPDGREYRARHSQEPSAAERAAYFEQIGQGAAGMGFKYAAPGDEMMDVEESGASATSGVSSGSARSPRAVKHERLSPVLPSSPQQRAEAAAAQRERVLLERERAIMSRERELAERENIVQYERDLERVYEERQRHYAAHPYYPRYERVERVPAHPAHVVHSAHPAHRPDYAWDHRVEHRAVDRHQIVYATRPPRSITPRGPPRSSSR